MAGPPRRRAVLEIDADAPQPHRSDESDLWSAVIMQAIKDAFINSDAAIRTTDRRADPDLTRGDARRFLTMSWGPWSESREIVAAAAGVDAEMLAMACRRKLRALKAGEKVIALDSMFAALVADADSLDAAALDRALSSLAKLENAAA